MKSIPNVMSILRMLLSIALLFLKPFTLLFWILYSLCGFSDIVDGYIARKTNSTSRLGSLLDSIGDIMFMGSAIIVFFPVIYIPIKIWIWIMGIFFIRIISMLVVFQKYHTFAMLHTYANKLTGLMLFCFPYLYNFTNTNIIGYLICGIASIAAVEELIIHIVSRELSRDIVGIFSKFLKVNH